MFGTAAEDEQRDVRRISFGLRRRQRARYRPPEDHIAAALYFECRTFLTACSSSATSSRWRAASRNDFHFSTMTSSISPAGSGPPQARRSRADAEIDEDAIRKKSIAQEAVCGGKTACAKPWRTCCRQKS